MFSHRERFFALQKGGSNYAPLTLGAPAHTMDVDYSTFKKDAREKVELAAIKAQHKRELIKSYGKGNTRNRMNPSYD
jgi:hypothetical protein